MLIKATDGDRVLEDPSDEQLHDLLADLNLRCNFVVVDRVGADPDQSHFIQVALFGEPGYGRYQVEHCEGGPSAFFRATVLRDSDWDSVLDHGFEQVVAVVQDWVADRPGWRTALPWARVDLSSEARQ